MLSVPFGYKIEWSCVNVFMAAHWLRQNYNYSRLFSTRGKARRWKGRTGFKGAFWEILGCCASYTGVQIMMSSGWKVGLTTTPKVWIFVMNDCLHLGPASPLLHFLTHFVWKWLISNLLTYFSYLETRLSLFRHMTGLFTFFFILRQMHNSK